MSSDRGEPTPLWAVASGHYTLGALKAVAVLLILWLVHFVQPAGYPGIGGIFWPVAVAVIVTSNLDLLTFRAASLRHHRSAPGSVTLTVVGLVSPLIGGATGTLLMPDRFWSLALAGVSWLVRG